MFMFYNGLRAILVLDFTAVLVYDFVTPTLKSILPPLTLQCGLITLAPYIVRTLQEQMGSRMLMVLFIICERILLKMFFKHFIIMKNTLEIKT